MTNQFIEKANQLPNTLTENGALAYTSVGTNLSSQFGNAGTYRGRSIENVFEDQSILWKENPLMALRFPFYLRMITRKIKMDEKKTTKTNQMGQGQRDECFKRLLWIARYQPESFYKNIWVLPFVGSWKDLWTLMCYDIENNLECIDHKVIFQILQEGLASTHHCNLVKKYLPRIQSNKRCTTFWTKKRNELAKEFAKFIGCSITEYNHLKSSGTAHQFQKLISQRQFDKLNWGHIPGKALNLLVNSKFIENQKLEENYIKYVEGEKTIKFTGYVYELAKQIRELGYSAKKYKTITIDKQFDELVKRAKEDNKITSNVWCAIDTSGSMSWEAMPGGVTAFDVATSLGLFFSSLTEGAFHKQVIMFDSVSKVQELKGSFSEMMRQLPLDAMGGTNFMSIVELICNIRKNNPDIPLKEYPTSLLVVSDMQFNPTYVSIDANTGKRVRVQDGTYEHAQTLLKNAFPEEWVESFKFIWWHCTQRVSKTFPSNLNDEACYYLSGMDGSVINLLLGEEIKQKDKKQITQEELVTNALSQEILSEIAI